MEINKLNETQLFKTVLKILKDNLKNIYLYGQYHNVRLCRV